MVLKKRYKRSYRWRLFWSMLVMMWIVVGVMMAFQYRREVDYRTEFIKEQLSLVNSRILDAYEHDVDLKPFMNFLRHYFCDSMFEDVMVSVYDRDGRLEYSIGRRMLSDFDEAKEQGEFQQAVEQGEGTEMRADGESMFFFSALRSHDGQVYVHTAVPFTVNIADALHVTDFTFWFVMVLLMIGTACMAYFSTNFLMKNIKMLREFAESAKNDNLQFDESKFPHNELGDISREIVKLYHERIEALRKSEREHDIALHAVEEKARLKRQLTNNINHELKTPVGVIRGYLDTVLTAEDMDSDTRRYFLTRAQDNVVRLCSLLNDVATMTRLEEGSGNIPKAEIDFHDLVYMVENDMKAAGEMKNMSFEFKLPFDCLVKGNSTLLVSVISNLIRNAVLHSRGTAMGLELMAESQRYYTFAFWDNGVGVAEEHIPHLFERFYRVDAGRSRKMGGTGLGLPIVKNTIEAMGGTITVRNRPEGGLSFLFTLEKWRGK